MERETLNFVIVGHVDHGKSTLIGRLLYDTQSLSPQKMEEVERMSKELGRDVEFAFVMDHLQEERDQGITIDTAQTFFKTDLRDYVIIDAPGHKEFIKNMITGASQAQAAVLIVDADEGVREQTRRHAYLLAMLGLEQVAVVINKMDLVEFGQERFDAVTAEVTEFLGKVGVRPLQVVPISAKEGDNIAVRSEQMEWYAGPIVLEVLDRFRLPVRPEGKPLRLPIQDVYKVDDRRIWVGRVESGIAEPGQEVVFLPAESETRITSVERFLEPPLEKAEAGESVGITLADPLFVERGQIACPPHSRPRVTDQVRANVFWMSKRRMEVGENLRIKCATQEVPAKLTRVLRRTDSSSLDVISEEAGELKNNEIGEVLIETREPIAVESFYDVPELGRFVLVRGNDVVAGGIVTK